MRPAFFGPGSLDLPPEGGLLLVRHAARHPILFPAQAYTAGLTGPGRASARAFGVQLGQNWRIETAVASPVARCLETAQEILEGALNGTHPHPPVQPLPTLHFDQKLTGIPGLQGVYLNDPNTETLASSPGLPEYALLRDTLLASLPFPTGPGRIALAVTHDVIVIFLLASLLQLPSATTADFPGFLQGICLVRDGGQVRLWNYPRINTEKTSLNP